MASSSKGNCTVVETPETKVIVDVGISFKRLIQNLEKHYISLSSISRLYITHAHSDHSQGLRTFLKRTEVPVYTRPDTKEVLKHKFCLEPVLLDKIKTITNKYCQEKDLKINYFKLPHTGLRSSSDTTTGEHIGFLFEWGKYKFSYLTDLGHITPVVQKINVDSNAYLIESNYDHQLQVDSDRHWVLKNRIMGDFGHLSNDQTANYLSKIVDPRKTKKIFLAHLSDECNTPEIAKRTVITKLIQKYGNLDTEFSMEVTSEIGKRYSIV